MRIQLATPVEFCMGAWIATPYRLCTYACSYCCVEVQGRSRPSAPPEELLRAMDAALARGGDHFWCIGGLSDAYPPEEEELEITRRVVGRLVDADARFTVVTKSILVERDADLFARTRRGDVTVSLSAVASEQLRRMEGVAPPAAERLRLLHRLHAAGVSCQVNILPFVPGVTDVGEILAAIPEEIPVTVSPLLFGPDRDSARFGGVEYVRSEVWDAYLASYERWGHVDRVGWIRPSLPPEENHPYRRLPRLSAPAIGSTRLRRDLVATARAREESALGGRLEILP